MDDKSDDVDLPSEETDGSRGCSPRPPGTPARLPFPWGTLLDPLLSPGASTWEHVPCSLRDWGGLSGPPSSGQKWAGWPSLGAHVSVCCCLGSPGRGCPLCRLQTFQEARSAAATMDTHLCGKACSAHGRLLCSS